MAERLIHCPFCRRVMARRNGHMYCDFGETGLAPIVEEAILNAIAAVEPATGTNSTSFTSNGFGCPNCTSPLEASGVVMSCASCGLTLPLRLHHILVEHHSHTHENEL